LENVLVVSPTENKYRGIAPEPVIDNFVSEIGVHQYDFPASDRLRPKKEIPLTFERGREIEVWRQSAAFKKCIANLDLHFSGWGVTGISPFGLPGKIRNNKILVLLGNFDPIVSPIGRVISEHREMWRHQ
jgi:hypothetical protein